LKTDAICVTKKGLLIAAQRYAMAYADAKNLKDPEQHPRRYHLILLQLSGLFKRLFDALHIAIAFMDTDESPVPSVYRHEWNGFHPEKWGEKIIGIPAGHNGGVLIQLKNLAETPDLVDRTVCGHDDPQVPKFLYPGCNGPGL
jgi:hypothetical protein